MSITLPEQYPLVIATATSTIFLHIYQYVNVSSNRRASGVKYPQLYADKAEAEKNPAAHKFNCAQRAHQNTLENLTYALLLSFVGGLKYPLVASGFLATWIFGRALYTYKYSKGDPTKRGGMTHTIAMFGLILTSVTAVGKLLLEMPKGALFSTVV